MIATLVIYLLFMRTWSVNSSSQRYEMRNGDMRRRRRMFFVDCQSRSRRDHHLALFNVRSRLKSEKEQKSATAGNVCFFFEYLLTYLVAEIVVNVYSFLLSFFSPSILGGNKNIRKKNISDMSVTHDKPRR